MPFETYQQLFLADEDPVIRPGKSLTLELSGDQLAQADRLFFTGETRTFYQWKNEPDDPQFYRRIDDALDSENAVRDQYSLHLQGQDYPWPIRAFRKQLWKPVLSYLGLHSYTDAWTCGISFKTKDLTFGEGGYLRMRFEVRYKKPGFPEHAAWGPVDDAAVIDIPEGTQDWTRVELPLTIPSEKTANVFIIVEGLHFSGEAWLEQPALTSSNGYNLLPDFNIYSEDRPQFSWMGMNLSRTEWPEFTVTVNGTTVHEGPVFERCHRYSEWEVPVAPSTLKDGVNTLTVTLTTPCREPKPYAIHEIGAITHAAGPVQLIAVPENITVGKAFPILVRTTAADLTLNLISDKIEAISDLYIEQPGLHVLRFSAAEPGTRLGFTLTSGDCSVSDVIRRAVIRQEDHVVTGTGDMIYIDQQLPDVEEFLSWYLGEHIGNLLTIRPTYRWSGNRCCNPEVWEELTTILNGMDVSYAHMIDGRELPGLHANPTGEMLKGKGFLGRQLHERDGAQVYWGSRSFKNQPNSELWYDMSNRLLEEYPEMTNPFNCPENLFIRGNDYQLYRDVTLPADMKAASDHVVDQLIRTRYGATRHTGPSSLFKYFYQAGYSWTGSETMYGPMELLIAAQRGAADAYHLPQIGCHHAVQWSSSPHDEEPRYRRYRLALYVSYMQGIHEINTEEGLWHMEEYFAAHNRFGEACTNHRKQQQDFYRYVSSHTRSGKFYTPIAYLYGRYDCWRVFGRENVWGRPDFPMAAPEKSWDLINYYYPLSVQNAIYEHPCHEGPKGFHTGTPQGNIDIVPMEAEKYLPYKMAAAIGYNAAMDEDMDKLQAYVEAGGTLLIGFPQFAVTTNRKDVTELNHTYTNHPFARSVMGHPNFADASFGGKKIAIGCEPPEDAEVLKTTDEGYPLVYRLSRGAGHIYFVNTRCYAADLPEVYLELMDQLTKETLAQEKSYISADEFVQFTCYLQEDHSRHYYLLAIDWFRPTDTPHAAALRLTSGTYEVNVPWGTMLKVVTDPEETAACWCESEDGEVLSVGKDGIRVQGIDTQNFHIVKDGAERTVAVDFGENAVQIIQ